MILQELLELRHELEAAQQAQCARWAKLGMTRWGKVRDIPFFLVGRVETSQGPSGILWQYDMWLSQSFVLHILGEFS